MEAERPSLFIPGLVTIGHLQSKGSVFSAKGTPTPTKATVITAPGQRCQLPQG